MHASLSLPRRVDHGHAHRIGDARSGWGRNERQQPSQWRRYPSPRINRAHRTPPMDHDEGPARVLVDHGRTGVAWQRHGPQDGPCQRVQHAETAISNRVELDDVSCIRLATLCALIALTLPSAGTTATAARAALSGR